MLERERELAWRSASAAQRERSLQETEERSCAILLEMDRVVEYEQMSASRCVASQPNPCNPQVGFCGGDAISQLFVI